MINQPFQRKNALNDSFDSLRLRVEAGRSLPLAICITSATAADGAGHVAYGLASAFASSGARTLAVLESELPQALDRPAPYVDGLASVVRGAVVSQPSGVDTVCMRSGGIPERQADARAAMLSLRGTYQVIVLEAGEAATRSAMLQRAKLADIAILAVRLGRPRQAADRALAERLEALGVAVLGVVSSAGDPGATAVRQKPTRTLPDPLAAPSRS
jgi:Mrp family chromosome partitioning ATPase